MKKKYFLTFLSIFFITILIISLIGCDDTGVNPKANYMGGTITYTNSSLIQSGGYYAVSFYGDSTSPFTKAPIRSDSLIITTSGGVTSAYYRDSSLAAGNYYIAATWINRYNGNVYALGVFGCDTVANCTPTAVAFPNFAGTGSVNIRSYTSISKALYYYHHP